MREDTKQIYAVVFLLAVFFIGLFIVFANKGHYFDKAYTLCHVGIEEDSFGLDEKLACLDKYGVNIRGYSQ